jgi:hypothetical protein
MRDIRAATPVKLMRARGRVWWDSGVAHGIAPEHARLGGLTPAPGWRMVVTGTINPYSGSWGIDRLSHQRRQFLRPVLPFNASVVSHNRRDQYWAKKLIFKKLCLRLEALCDDGGAYASMNTNFVLPGSVDLFALTALFHSTLMTWLYEGYFGALRMGGGYLQVQAPQLRVLPMPPIPADVSEAELDQLVEGVDPLNPDLGLEPTGLYALLRLLGRESLDGSMTLYEARRDLAIALLKALGLDEKRQEEPAFVLPRQDAIFAAVEDLDAPDLEAFWGPFRRTTRQLRVDMTSAREQGVIEAVHAARESMEPAARRLAVLSDRIDAAVYALYGLTDGEVERVRSGHSPPPGVTAAQEAA